MDVAELDPAWWWLPGARETGEKLQSVDDQRVFEHDDRAMFAMAEAVGARSLNAVDVFGGTWTLDEAAEAFATLCDRAANHGLLVHLEALPWSRIADVSTAWDIVRRADRPKAVSPSMRGTSRGAASTSKRSPRCRRTAS